MARFHLINGVKVPYTAEEEIARDKEEAAYASIRAANEYSWKRAETYPSIQEQLDLLWHAIDDDDADLKSKFSAFYNSIKEVKDANPKP